MSMRIASVALLIIGLSVSACSQQDAESAPPVNQVEQVALLLNAADGDMNIVQASGGDVEKARLLAAGKRMAVPDASAISPEATPAPVEAKSKRANCWTPPSGPNVIEDGDRPLRWDEVEEIEEATGRTYQPGDTIHGRAENRCPA